MIPILDLVRQYKSLKPELDAAVLGVLAAGTYINGPNVQAFQAIGTPFAIGVNSGTDALHLALRALDVGPGDEVITTPFTFVATSEAIAMTGATPVFADIDPLTYNIDPGAIENAIGARTKAILPVHLYGRPAPMCEIVALAKKHGLLVVEDCAQALGAEIGGRQVGTFGDAAAFSFFPSKNLGAFGDGGLVTTAEARVAERVRTLRAHGAKVKYYHEEVGVNSRLDELQAAILRVKLPHLAHWNRERRHVAQRYTELLAGREELVLPAEDAAATSVYHQYTIRTGNREQVAAALRAAGIQTMVYYPLPLHLQAVHSEIRRRQAPLPHSEAAAAGVLSLPMFPELTDAEVVCVARAVENIVGGIAA
jgi:dTDP-4-amino-4,6-dideoxygalactose transaminase